MQNKNEEMPPLTRRARAARPISYCSPNIEQAAIEEQ